MKVNYRNMLRGYRGKKDGLVYYYHPGLHSCIAREYVAPRITEQNHRIGAVLANLKTLAISEGYKGDLKIYLHLLRTHAETEDSFRGNQWSLFTKMMWRMQSANPASIDLRTITRDFIYANDLPCISVKRAVEGGLLPEVAGYEVLTREL